jgi:hypothetical protein
LPQGLLKKIEFYLLLADLALELDDAFARGGDILHPRGPRLRAKLDRPWDLPRATGWPQRFSSTATVMPVPFAQMTSRNP